MGYMQYKQESFTTGFKACGTGSLFQGWACKPGSNFGADSQTHSTGGTFYNARTPYFEHFF